MIMMSLHSVILIYANVCAVAWLDLNLVLTLAVTQETLVT